MAAIKAKVNPEPEDEELGEQMESEDQFKVSKFRRAGGRIHIGTWVSENCDDPVLKVRCSFVYIVPQM